MQEKCKRKERFAENAQAETSPENLTRYKNWAENGCNLPKTTVK